MRTTHRIRAILIGLILFATVVYAARSSIATSAFTGTDGATPTDFTALNPGDGTPNISTNRIKATAFFTSSTDSSDVRWTGAGTFTAAQYAKITVTGLGNPGGLDKMGVVLRAGTGTDTSRSMYRVYVYQNSTTQICYAKVVAGDAGTPACTNRGTFANGDTVEAEVEEITGTTTIRTYHGVAGTPTLVATISDVTSPITATGAPGFTASGGFGALLFGDDWEAGNLTGGGGGSSALPVIIQQQH